MRRIAMIAGALGLLLFGAEAHAQDEYAKLIRIIRTDSAYKVRMQAIRVLSKQLEKTGDRPSDDIIDALAQAATKDDEHLVRGMACAVMGKLADDRGRPALERALSDSDAFVRQQAKEALGKLRPASKRVLVISTDRTPAVSATPEIEGALKSRLEQGFGSAASGQYAVGESSGTGYHMKGSVAELSVAPAGDQSQVTIVVRIAIATWPDNNLRHVISAKASARAKVAGPSLVKLQLKLLEAAVSKAIQDSMAQIGGG
jgi:HEAT repeat protein